MTKKYRNPPLIEALVEFRILPDSPWDLTVHGLIYEKIKKTFPHKEQRLIQEVDIKQGPKGIEQQVHVSERSFFFTNDKTMFVQIGQHLLAINCLRPYPTWREFKPRIEEAFNALLNSIDVKGLAKISHRAINRIEVPLSPINLGDFFEFRPFLGTRLPRNMRSFILGCVLPFFNERDLCKVQLTTGAADTPSHSAFLLDIDYFLAKPEDLPVDNALVWVEEAHENVNNIFEGCVTDRLREVFQEETV
ncbi:MAG: TIGR04255 family protein [Candidatus Entotheonellia bacterium]